MSEVINDYEGPEYKANDIDVYFGTFVTGEDDSVFTVNLNQIEKLAVADVELEVNTVKCRTHTFVRVWIMLK